MLWALTFKRVSVFWQKVGRNDTQTEDERESESVCLQGAQHWRYIASILPGVLLRVGQGHFMVAICLSRPQFSCHTENWKSILHEHKHTLSAVSFYLQHFFWKPCSPLLKTSQHKLFGCQKKKPPPSWSVQSSCFNHDCFNAPVYRSRLQHLEHWCFLFFLVTQRTAPPQTPPSPSSQLFLHPWQWREAPGPWLNPGVV